MSKNAQVNTQLNIKLTGENKIQLLEQLNTYLSKYRIGKADFFCLCLEEGMKRDLANESPSATIDSSDIQKQINDAILPIQQQLQELAQRLGELKGRRKN
ncbi:MAG: hypothetical protein AAFY76_04680 [Cyanobacteria bacterium J06649_11]